MSPLVLAASVLLGLNVVAARPPHVQSVTMSGATAQLVAPPTQPVADMLARVIGQSAAAKVELVLTASPPAACNQKHSTLADVPDDCVVVSAGSKPGNVLVKGTSVGALGYGCGRYLRDSCNTTLTWVKTGGMNVPKACLASLPQPSAPVVLRRSVKWTYYQNVVENSYSSVWWDFTRWQTEIDWMALQGINLALAYNGQEAVFRKLYLQHGLNDTELGKFFNGPAFLSWSRGQGMAGVGGPLPLWWYDQQAALNKQIVTAMRTLGIKTILPGFQGNVPVALKKVYPSANISNAGWLDDLDPLFTSLSDMYMKLLIDEFGTDHYYQADGLFSHKTGPWAQQDGPEESGMTDFSTPFEPDHDAFLHSQAAYNGMARTDPDAVWVYQTWIWRGYSTKNLPFLKGWISAVPEGRYLLLDQTAERIPLWKDFDNFSFFNTSFVWCAMHEMGGNIGMFGDLSIINAGPITAMHTSPSMVGVGIDPEGIDQNPVYYAAVIDTAWRSEEVNLTEYFADWARQRCGRRSAAAEQAWALLSNTVYASASWQHYEHHMKYCPTTMPFGSGWDTPMVRPHYEASDLYQAWLLLLEAASECDLSDAFVFDLVDVGREYLSLFPCVAAYDALTKGKTTGDIQAANTTMNHVMADLDTLLSTSAGFLLGQWVSDARALAESVPNATAADVNFLEFNARSQVTSWFPTGHEPVANGNINGNDRALASGLPGLWDYGNKMWAGLVGQFYVRRYNAYADVAVKQIAENRHRLAIDVNAFHEKVVALSAAFATQTWDPKALPNKPIGDPVATSSALAKKYKPSN